MNLYFCGRVYGIFPFFALHIVKSNQGKNGNTNWPTHETIEEFIVEINYNIVLFFVSSYVVSKPYEFTLADSQIRLWIREQANKSSQMTFCALAQRNKTGSELSMYVAQVCLRMCAVERYYGSAMGKRKRAKRKRMAYSVWVSKWVSEDVIEQSEFCTVSRQIRFVASYIYNIGILFMKVFYSMVDGFACLWRWFFYFSFFASTRLHCFYHCEIEIFHVCEMRKWFYFYFACVWLLLLYFSLYFHLAVQCEPIYSNFAERAHVSPFVHIR